MLTFTPSQLRHQPGDIDEHEPGFRIVNATNLPADRCFQSTAVIIGPTAIESIPANFDYSPEAARRRAMPPEQRAKERRQRILAVKQRRIDASAREAREIHFRSISQSGPQVPRAHIIASHVKPH